MFLNPGGVVAETVYIPLPAALLGAVAALDRLLVAIAPQLFALQLQVVLKKKP